MDTPSVADRFRHVVAEALGIQEDKITEHALFIEDLGADSLDQVELVMSTEEEFDFEISDDDAEKILTFSDGVKYIEKALGNG